MNIKKGILILLKLDLIFYNISNFLQIHKLYYSHKQILKNYSFKTPIK